MPAPDTSAEAGEEQSRSAPGSLSSLLLRRLISWACTHRRAADLVHATKASCSEPFAAKETPADGLEQRQATAASSSVGIGESIA